MIRPQYHFRPGPEGLMAWNVARLIRAAASLPVHTVPISEIAEIDEAYWNTGRTGLSVRDVAEHAALINAADISIPILLCADGRVMDGMHRVARCLIDRVAQIPARRFPRTPKPDVYPADPETLSYEPDLFRLDD